MSYFILQINGITHNATIVVRPGDFMGIEQSSVLSATIKAPEGVLPAGPGQDKDHGGTSAHHPPTHPTTSKIREAPPQKHETSSRPHHNKPTSDTYPLSTPHSHFGDILITGVEPLVGALAEQDAQEYTDVSAGIINYNNHCCCCCC